MLGVVDGSDHLRLASPEYFQGEGYKGPHACVPAILGLLVPLLIPAIVAPSALGSALPVLLALLLLLLVFSAGVAIASLVFKGEVVSLTLVPEFGSLELRRAGLFANTTTRMPLSRVAAVEMGLPSRRYDLARARLVTTDGRAFELPEDISRAEIIAFRGRIEELRGRIGKAAVVPREPG